MPNDAPERIWCVACERERSSQGAIYLSSNGHEFEIRQIETDGSYSTRPLLTGVCSNAQHRNYFGRCVCGCERLLTTDNYYRNALGQPDDVAVGGVPRGRPLNDDGTYQWVHQERCDTCGRPYFATESHGTNGRCIAVRQYTYRPEPFTFFGGEWDNDDQTDPLFMGMELEVEVDRNVLAERITDLNSFAHTLLDTLDEMDPQPRRVYFKSDASIRHGFEIVTMPHTLEAFRESDLIDTIAQQAELSPTNDARNVGIHIHVNRSAFRDPAHLWRFLQLHHRNPTFVKAIAGRGSVQYARWEAADELFARAEEVAREKDRPWIPGAGHGTVINTGNENTIELRYFKATVVPELIRKNLEWVHSAWEYCQGDTPPQLDSLSFLDWLATREEDFPHFVNWCRENELLLDQATVTQQEAPLEPTFEIVGAADDNLPF